MKPVLCALALLLVAAPGLAAGPGTHLEPESRIWDTDRFWDDTRIVRAVFHEAFDDDVALRLYTTAAMVMSQQMVVLKHAGGSTRIVTLETKVALFEYTERGRQGGMSAHLPADYRQIRPERCEIAIPAPLAGRIAGVWRRVLLQTRYDAKPWRGLDGANYAFWMRTGDLTVLSGRVWSPNAGTEPDLLIGVAQAMQALCAARDAGHLSALSRQVGLLEYHLQADAAP